MDGIIILLCKLLQRVMSYMHRGSSLPGKLALKYDKKLLGKLSAKYRVVLITGTNGKTTTASLLAKMLKDGGLGVIHNAAGANMLSGIMTMFISHSGDRKKEIAVVEIDEANVPLYAEVASAEYIICTNIFKDQLDRYGEIYTTLNKIKEGIEKIPEVKMILNGDEPLFGNFKGNTVYFGFTEQPCNDKEEKSNVEGKFCINCREKYHYEFTTYNHLGKYECLGCGYKRPELSYCLSDVNIIDDNHIKFKINNEKMIESEIGGIYNLYNILAAYAAAMELTIDSQILMESIQSYKPRFGRTEAFEYNGIQFKIILVKNPAGFNQGLSIPAYNSEDKCGCFVLNDNYADGKDVSWIWDVDFESTKSDFKDLLIGGIRNHDMAIRLQTAGYKINSMKIYNSLEGLVEELIKYNKCKYIYIYATYTAMLSIRELFAKKKIINHSW